MKLEKEFDSSLESIINLCPPLANWFSKNQVWMAYFNLTKPGIDLNHLVHMDNYFKILGIMSSKALTELYNKDIPEENRAFNAMNAIAEIYELEKDRLTEGQKNLLSINIEILEKTETPSL